MTRARSAPLFLALTVLVWPAGAGATLVFQNVGVKAGWTSIGIQHIGKVDEVAMPTFDGPTALRMEQTFEGFSGYHSEVRLHEAQGPVGSEAYYGMALYLPPSWIFHDQNVTFQQWARGDVFASPWVLMYVENDEIHTGGSGGVRGLIAKITGMQGKWIRVVTHIKHHPTNGLFEVWVNGVKGLTFTGKVSPAADAPIRWSAGMYCTRWREEQPRGLNPMVLFQDHYRVATTYEEADPMSWKGGAPPPPAEDGGVSPADAGADGGEVGEPPALPPDAAAAPVSRDAAPDRARSVPPDAGAGPGEEPGTDEPVRPASRSAGGGCTVAQADGPRGLLVTALLTLALAGWRRRRGGLAATSGKGTLDAGDGSGERQPGAGPGGAGPDPRPHRR